MDFRRLRNFIVCAEELHFTRAAQRIGMAQPPLSQQIQVLEGEVGTRLFHRLSRGVELTPAGHSFLKDAIAIIELADRAIASAQQIARGELGSIRVGFTGSAAFNPFVSAVIGEFRMRREKVEILLSEATTTASLEMLRAGLIDVAFLRPGAGETDRLRSRRLFDEEMLAVLPIKHPLARLGSVQLMQLAKDPFVLCPRADGRAQYDAVIGACQNAGFSPSIVQEAPQMATSVSLVAAGIGVTLVPLSMSQLQTQGVTYCRIKGPSPKASLNLVYREAPLSIVLNEFVETVRRAAADLSKPATEEAWPLGTPGGE